jgi:hypothetical protein
MDQRTAATPAPDPDAVEFIRFCYRRRRVGWPELYDEMCAVAGRGLYRGYGTDDLAALGIGFSLYDMPALAVMARRIVDEEQALRRPMTVTLAPIVEEVLPAPAPVPTPAADRVPTEIEAQTTSEPIVRFTPVPAPA